MRIEPLGDSAVVIHLGESASERTFGLVRAATARLRVAFPEADASRGIRDIVPGFASVTIHYDPALFARADGRSPYDNFSAELLRLLADLKPLPSTSEHTVEIPVRYGGAYGEDLESVARHSDLSPHDAVALHSSGSYTVRMIGFLPGFPYLDGLDRRLEIPRLDSPRAKVPMGSVGIGGSHTGVYPLESPGGWRLIGRTPLRLFVADRDPPVLLRVGDGVRFREISDEEFRAIVESAP